MTELFVAFSDDSEAVITAYAASPQPAESWPYQGVVEPSDARWATYFNGLPTAARAFLTAPT